MARIVVPEKDGVSYGSGTLVDARGQFGLVVTNWHVVRDAAGPVNVEFPEGFKSPAQVVKTDRDWDLAALSIYRPRAAPLPITPAAPQPGEWLAIAGYGGGEWRVVGGPCTQYLAPGIEFPHELVELAAEARQGDSGGPIFNQRGELAGVLFGSGPGYTSGSYGGRVLKFLATVVPGGAPGSDGAPPALEAPAGEGRSSAHDRGLASLVPSHPTAALDTSHPQATALHAGAREEERSPAPLVLDPGILDANKSAALTAAPAGDAPLLTPPAKSEFAAPLVPSAADDEIDPRVAVAPDRVASRPAAIAPAAGELTTRGLAPAASAIPPRTGGSNVDLNHARPGELLAAFWKQVGGTTFLDQSKTVLAGVGLLALVVLFWRMGSQKEEVVHDE